MSVSHVVDCCGTVRIRGIRADEGEHFRAFARACGTAGSCECLAGPSVTDDGRAVTPAAAVNVRCELGACVTSGS